MMKSSSKGYFLCKNCGAKVSFLAPGTKNRNHCPECLFSLHVDKVPGDRLNSCGGLMEPIGRTTKSKEEDVIVHKCRKCNFVRLNRVAGDDNEEAFEKLPLLSQTSYGTGSCA